MHGRLFLVFFGSVRILKHLNPHLYFNSQIQNPLLLKSFLLNSIEGDGEGQARVEDFKLFLPQMSRGINIIEVWWLLI